MSDYLKYISIILIVIIFILIIYFINYRIDPEIIIKSLKQVDVNVINANDLNAIKNKRPWDIQVNDPSFYDDIMRGTLGIGESYMDGKWDCDALDVMFDKVRSGKLDKKIKFDSMTDKFKLLINYLSNQQAKGDKSYEVEKIHYDIGNDLYKNMLGNTMAYSCAYWTPIYIESKRCNTYSEYDQYNELYGETNLTDFMTYSTENINQTIDYENKMKKNKIFDLDQAQLNKFELICKKLQLNSNDHVLDIGSGFGSLAKYMADNYGCHVTGINISKEQLKYANQLCHDHIQNGLIRFIDCDYRDTPLLPNGEKYDKIVSVGFCEHVGYRNYRVFCQKMYDCLKDGGLFLLHTIGSNTSVTSGDAWIDRYIFPNGQLPSVNQLSGAAEGLFIIEDLHNFGPHYDKTLMAWHHNYENAIKTGKLQHSKRFYRMWKYYLLICAASFRSRSIQLWQIVFSKDNKNLYKSIR